jgi:hypothetical protein
MLSRKQPQRQCDAGLPLSGGAVRCGRWARWTQILRDSILLHLCSQHLAIHQSGRLIRWKNWRH